MYKNIALYLLTLLPFRNQADFHSKIEKQITILNNNPTQLTGLEHLTRNNNNSVPQVTIWLHASKIINFVGDYAHATHRPGLMHMSELPWNYRLKSLLETLSAADQVHFPADHMYAFGWSGSISFQERKNEGQNLYNALKILVATYKQKYGVAPHITFITHSHGGNVLLNMSLYVEKDFSQKVSAVFLGCPVQIETKEFVHNPLFEKLYSFYSENDWIQAADPQGLYKSIANPSRKLKFSERIFCPDPKMRQVHFKINGSGIWHLGYIRHYFVSILPRLIKEIDEWEIQTPSVKGQERILSVIYQQ